MRTTESRKNVLREQALAAMLLLAVPLAACRSEVVTPLPPPVVETAVVERTDSARDLRISGTLDAERSTMLSFAVPGTVEQVFFDVGQNVKRGQVIARLTSTTFDAALGIAVAQNERAEDSYRRFEPMHKNGTVPEVKWVEAATGRDSARHAVDLARKNLKDSVLRAPEDGVIARRSIEPGSTAAPGTPAFVLVQTRTVRAIAPVPEADVARIRVGQPARVFVGALGREFTGSVYEIGVVADPLTRTYSVKITLANPDDILKVGMVVDAFLPLPGEAPALTVPREAVRIDEHGAACVFVLGPDQKVQRRKVEVIGFAGEKTALRSGVDAGDKVVVSGTPMLADGVTVRTPLAQFTEK